MSPRKFIVGGNWKMYGDTKMIKEMLSNMNNGSLNENVEVVIGVPSVYLSYVKNMAPNTIQVAAQNCWKVAKGAFTGEVSPSMLKDIGVDWVILGHSERRILFGEKYELIAEKVAHALESGMKVIACIGETLEERESGRTEDVIFRQLKSLTSGINKWEDIVLAYEPVWAIGTGKTASPEQAQEVHASIRNWLLTNISSEVAVTTRIQYGGSVNAGNAKQLSTCPDIDGFLVGGASLKPEFIDIVNSKYIL